MSTDMQWATLALALLSLALWLLVSLAVLALLHRFRHETQAARAMARAMRTARPPVPSADRPGP